jgi:hypothetical protein
VLAAITAWGIPTRLKAKPPGRDHPVHHGFLNQYPKLFADHVTTFLNAV